MSVFNKHREQFSKDKKDLDPNFKPETNIAANIVQVRSISAGREQNPQGDDYAVFKMVVDIENEDGLATKEWKISSETLVDTMAEKGIEIGSSFTVKKTGEGFKTKYEITNVVNKPVVAGGSTVGASLAPATPHKDAGSELGGGAGPGSASGAGQSMSATTS